MRIRVCLTHEHDALFLSYVCTFWLLKKEAGNTQCLNIERQLTVFDFVNLSSHLIASSGETLLFDKSI